VLGDELNILNLLQDAKRSKTINTSFVESRNGKFRKDDARLIRKTLCHSKKAIFHDAHADLLTQVMNYTRTNDALKVLINPSAGLFEQKYHHRTPAMAEGIIDKVLTIKELLTRRPKLRTIPWLDFYMREYVETGTLQLLSLDGNADFPVSPMFAPDFKHVWAFGLEMPKKTDLRLVITANRDGGLEASWCDGFLPEKLTLEQQIQRVTLEEFGLPNLQIIATEAEFEAQRTQFGAEYRSFSSLLRQALNTVLHDYLTPGSVFNKIATFQSKDIRPEDFDDPREYRAAIHHLIINYLKTAGKLELLPAGKPQNNPEDGEAAEQFWRLFLSLQAFPDLRFWVLIPRFPDDGQLSYCYGL